MMQGGLLQQFGFSHNCLYLRSRGILVAADVHIGMEEELRTQGLHFPLREEEILLARFGKAVDLYRPERVILNGDIIHSFATVPRRVQGKCQRILEFLEDRSEVILLAGLHDRLLTSFAGRPVGLEMVIGEWLITHGDRALSANHSLIIGHEHPVLAADMVREPCFLIGESVLHGKDVIILPAFNPLCQGVVVNSLRPGEFLAPVLADIESENLRPLVECAGEVFLFPELGRICRESRPAPL
jgi:putative SbcD/Mre11-related phosphoesterase